MYSLYAIRDILTEMKASREVTASTQSVRNIVDFMRIVSLPGSDGDSELPGPNPATFLFKGQSNSKQRPPSGDRLNEDSASEDGDSDEDVSVPAPKRAKKVTKQQLQRSKRGKGLASMPLSKQLAHLPCYRRLFSKCWLLSLALPMTNALHKVVLKHLPDHGFDTYTTHSL